MPNHKHLTLEERNLIAAMLKQRHSFRSIAGTLDKDPSTISKEIRSRLVFRRIGGMGINFNACKHRSECHKAWICSPCRSERRHRLCKSCSLCNLYCKDFEPKICEKLSRPPYVCNGCTWRSNCSLEKRLYIADDAHREYLQILSETRSGTALCETELLQLESLVSPLIKKGQSPHHICITNKDFLSVSERTIYRLIDRQMLSARNMDLPRKVRFSARKKSVTPKVDKKCRVGRDFNSFLEFMELHPDVPVVQLDSVIGARGGKVLLTIHFARAEFMLAFLRERNDSASVIRIFEQLYECLKPESFRLLFPVCLTDNGTEFSNPGALETDSLGNSRTRIFYCNPSAPYQKGSAERNHEFIRRFLPKGKSFDALSQDDVRLMMDHINSYRRASLGNKSPYEVFSFLYGQDIPERLECRYIPPQDVTLKPSIFRKGVIS